MKNRFKYYWLLVCLWAGLPCIAQKNTVAEADSLERVLAKEKNDSIKVRLLQAIGIAWNARNPNKAHQYYDQAIVLSKKINNESMMAGVMASVGYLYSGTGQNVKAIQTLQEAIRIKTGRNKPTIANCQCFIAVCFQNLGDLDNALKYAKLCYDFYNTERIKTKGEMPWPIFEGNIGSNMALGEIYMNRGRLDSAQSHLEEAYRLLKIKNLNRYFAFHIPELLGKMHSKRQQFKQAKPYLDEAIHKATIYSDTVGLALAWAEMATYYTQINKPDSAVWYANKAIPAGMKIKHFEAIIQSGKLLKEYYTQQKNTTKALYYSDLVAAVQDSLSNADQVKQSQRLLYEEQQSQQAIVQLEIDNQNRLVRYGLVGGLVLVLLAALILWLNNARKQQENKNLDAKIKLQESEFAHKLAETEMTALRTQMNPHFIFNCLNSIKLYTLENDSLKATEYMTKFSRLIRLVLENSRSQCITLANELETLELYIQMEVMRFKDKVNYQINIAPEIDTHYIEIPPLLLQPYIENAIWHGLMHKDSGGMITIDVSMNETTLRVTITDNGIGRAAAAELKSKSATNHKSFGMKMTSERVELFNQLHQTNTQVKIEDLAVGTRVTVEIPV